MQLREDAAACSNLQCKPGAQFGRDSRQKPHNRLCGVSGSQQMPPTAAGCAGRCGRGGRLPRTWRPTPAAPPQHPPPRLPAQEEAWTGRTGHIQVIQSARCMQARICSSSLDHPVDRDLPRLVRVHDPATTTVACPTERPCKCSMGVSPCPTAPEALLHLQLLPHAHRPAGGLQRRAAAAAPAAGRSGLW
jgi:hypothetical protein